MQLAAKGDRRADSGVPAGLPRAGDRRSAQAWGAVFRGREERSRGSYSQRPDRRASGVAMDWKRTNRTASRPRMEASAM